MTRPGDQSEPAYDEGGASYRPGDLDEAIIGEHYRIEAAIGVGGSGRVFKVRHRRLGKTFALKLMRGAFASSDRAAERFWREALVAGTLSHPNIVAVLDYGEDRRLGPFILMELVDGELLAARLRRSGPFGLLAACDITLQVGQALRYVHGRGIVHGDIKAENVLLCRADPTDRRGWTAKLFDFGLARAADDQPAGQRSIVDGTPAYLAPERITGGPMSVGADIYAVGVLFFELVAGREPFVGSWVDVMDAHVKQPPPRLAEVLGAAVDERAEAFVARALAKSPAERHGRMDELLYELRTLMEMLGIARRRTSLPLRIDRAAGEERLRSLFQLSPVPAACLDLDGAIVAANPAFARLVSGDAAQPVAGGNVRDTALCAACPELAADARRCILSGAPLTRTVSVAADDGAPLRILLTLVPAPGHAEACLYAQVFDDRMIR